MIRKYRPYIITFYILAVAGLITAVFFDLQIDITLNNPEDIFAVWFRNTGEIPSRMICPLAGAVLFYTCNKAIEKIIAALIELGGSAYLGYYLGDYFFEENKLIYGIIFGIGIGTVILFTGNYIHIPKKQAAVLKKLAIYGIIVMAVQLTVIEVVKDLWGRVRFRDLLEQGSYQAYTPWYIINGKNGNKSFPSGHTAGAAMSYLLMMLPYSSKKAEKKYPLYFIIPFIYTSVVAYTRLVMGAHYLSDVSMGGIIGFTTVLIAMAVFEKVSLKKLSNQKIPTA